MTSTFDPEGREAAMLASIPEFERARVLEIGIGDGRLTWNYAGRAAAVVGVDPDLEALGFLLEDRPPRLRKRILPACAASEHLPFPSERFDAALLSWSL